MDGGLTLDKTISEARDAAEGASAIMANWPKSPTGRGKIVALEGPSEMVAAQLRLLPVSSQIMILPSLQQYLSGREAPSTTKQLIYRVHMAAQRRHAAATSFLEESTPDKKRVVFLEGGTVSARVLCISTISYNVTDGDLKKAEAIFDELTKCGVAGLVGDEEVIRANSMLLGGGKGEREQKLWEGDLVAGEMEDTYDPVLRAMRAADVLDQMTEGLQSPSNDVDLSACWFNNSRTWSRKSLRLPPKEFAGHVRSPRLPDVTTEAHHSIAHHQRSLLTSFEGLFARRVGRPAALSQDQLETRIPTSPLRWDDQEGDVSDTTPPDITDPSRATTPDYVTPSEQLSAEIPAPLAWSKPKERKRSISFDLGSSRSEDHAKPTAPEAPQRRRPPMLSLVTSNQIIRKRSVRSLDNVTVEEVASTKGDSASECIAIPISSLVKALRTSSVLEGLESSRDAKLRDEYIDKATDTTDLDEIRTSEAELTRKRPFQEVLPVLEDLVIRLVGDTPGATLERVYQGLRGRAQGKNAQCLEPAATHSCSSNPSTPANVSTGPGLCRGSDSETTWPLLDDPVAADITYNSVVMHGAQSGFPRGKAGHGRLPTPPYDLYSPAQFGPEPDQRFQTLNVGQQTETSVQNKLRLILSSYIPSEVWTQHPSRASSTSKAGTPWKPVLWKPEPREKLRSCKELDMILAIGADRSVKKSYTSAVVNQIEKLGLDAAGESRSGRLDLRYLIANAMQAFTCQPLTKQTRDSPFTNSSTLANLLLPHLEAYLFSHPNVRFLILEYTAEHLPTVLALRKLIGPECFKVAGITGTDMRPSSAPSDSEKYAFAELRSVGGLDAFNNPVSPKSCIPFTKANYILTSSATRAEIAGFVSAIHDTLVSISTAYCGVDPSVETRKQKRVAQPSWSHLKQDTFLSTSTLETPPASPRDFASTVPQTPLWLAPGSVQTIRPGTSRSEGRAQRGVFPGSTPTIRSKSRVDEDDDYDAEERRLMPLYLRREAERGNGEKALRWLGLT